MKIKYLFLAALILVVTSIGFAQSKTKVKPSGIRSVDFFNYSHRTSLMNCHDPCYKDWDEQYKAPKVLFE